MPQISFTAGKSLDISADSNIRTIIALFRTGSASTKPFGGNQVLTTPAQNFGLGEIDSGISSNTLSIVVWQMTPGAYSIHVNGENKGSSTSSLTPAAFDKVGNDFIGDMLEVIAYDRALNDGVRQKLEGYLAHKWDSSTSLIP